MSRSSSSPPNAASASRHAARARLAAEDAHGLRARPEENQAGPRADVDEVGVFREQAVSGWMACALSALGDPDDLLDLQIDCHRSLADLVGVVGLEAAERQLVLFGVDCERLPAQLNSPSTISIRRPAPALISRL